MKDNTFLGTEKTGKLLFKLAVPAVTAQLVNLLYNLVDRIYIGHIAEIGTEALTGVGVCLPIIMLISAFAYLVGSGGAPRASIFMGSGDNDTAEKILGNCFTLLLGVSVVLTVVFYVWNEPLLMAFGASEKTVGYGVEYMAIYALGTIFVLMALGLNVFITAQGFTVVSMLSVVIGAVLNIALDPLFIFAFGMNVEGAALATILSQLVGFCLLLTGVYVSGGIRIRLCLFSPSPARYADLARGGIPSLCRQGLASIAVTCLNTAARPYGDAAIAAMSIVTRVSQFAGSAMTGFGQGFQPVCGFNYGARKYERVTRGFRFCVKASSLILLTLAVLGFLFAPQIIAVFRGDDPEVVRIGAKTLRLQCISFPVTGFVVMSNMLLQNIAMTLRASVVAAARQGLFFVPFALILPHLFGLAGVQCCQAASDLCAFILALCVTLPVVRQLSRGENPVEYRK